MHQLYLIIRPSDSVSCQVFMLLEFCTSVLVHDAFGTGRERNAYQEGRKLLLRSSGTAAVECFIGCSPTPIDTYIRPPALPQWRFGRCHSQLSFLSLPSVARSLFVPTGSCSVSPPPNVRQPLPPFSSFITSLPQWFLMFHVTIIAPSTSFPLSLPDSLTCL